MLTNSRDNKKNFFTLFHIEILTRTDYMLQCVNSINIIHTQLKAQLRKISKIDKFTALN